MLPHPGLPLHLQAAPGSKQSSRAALPFSRSCWSILPTRVFKSELVFPLLGVRGKGSAGSGGVDGGGASGSGKEQSFVILEMFPSSPFIEHGVAEGDE